MRLDTDFDHLCSISYEDLRPLGGLGRCRGEEKHAVLGHRPTAAWVQPALGRDVAWGPRRVTCPKRSGREPAAENPWPSSPPCPSPDEHSHPGSDPASQPQAFLYRKTRRGSQAVQVRKKNSRKGKARRMRCHCKERGNPRIAVTRKMEISFFLTQKLVKSEPRPGSAALLCGVLGTPLPQLLSLWPSWAGVAAGGSRPWGGSGGRMGRWERRRRKRGCGTLLQSREFSLTFPPAFLWPELTQRATAGCQVGYTHKNL